MTWDTFLNLSVPQFPLHSKVNMVCLPPEGCCDTQKRYRVWSPESASTVAPVAVPLVCLCRVSLKPSSHGHSCCGGSILELPELPAQVVEVSLLGACSALPHGSSRGPGDLAAEGVQIGAPGSGVEECQSWREAPVLQTGRGLRLGAGQGLPDPQGCCRQS